MIVKERDSKCWNGEIWPSSHRVGDFESCSPADTTLPVHTDLIFLPENFFFSVGDIWVICMGMDHRVLDQGERNIKLDAVEKVNS